MDNAYNEQHVDRIGKDRDAIVGAARFERASES
jgi:hypothetical protein